MDDKLKKYAIEFVDFAEMMRRQGKDDQDIEKTLYDHIKMKKKKFNQFMKGHISGIGALIDIIIVEAKKKSLATVDYPNILSESGLNFRMGYWILSYEVDFLINGKLVFEIGKQRSESETRIIDQLGYDYFNIPEWLALIEPRVIVDEIKRRLKKT